MFIVALVVDTVQKTKPYIRRRWRKTGTDRLKTERKRNCLLSRTDAAYIFHADALDIILFVSNLLICYVVLQAILADCLLFLKAKR